MTKIVLIAYLYSSSIIVRVIISRRMRWAGNVARMGQRRGVFRVLVGKPERDHLKDPGVDGRIIQDGSSVSGWWWLGVDRAGSG